MENKFGATDPNLKGTARPHSETRCNKFITSENQHASSLDSVPCLAQKEVKPHDKSLQDPQFFKTPNGPSQSLLRKSLVRSGTRNQSKASAVPRCANAVNEDIPATSILLEDCEGRYYSPEWNRLPARVCIKRGSLLRTEKSYFATDTNYDYGVSKNRSFRQDTVLTKCLDVDGVYVKAPKMQIGLLTDREASLLKSIKERELRYRFFWDTDLFYFVSQLVVGDRVVVQGDEQYTPGCIEWVGEVVTDEGLLFGVRFEKPVGDMDGYYAGRRLFSAPKNSAVLVSGDRLRNPRSVSMLDQDPKYSLLTSSERISIPTTLTSRREPHVNCEEKTPITFKTLPGNEPLRPVPAESTTLPVHLGSGTKYSLAKATNSSETLKFAHHQLESVLTNVSAPVVRNVPIKFVPVCETARTQSPSCVTNARFPVEDELYGSVERVVPDRNRLPPSLTHDVNVNITRHVPSSSDTTRLVMSPLLNKTGTSTTSDDAAPLFVKLPICKKTRRVKVHRLADGDRVVWFDQSGRPCYGTVRWTGRLRGHSNIYAGVEFDEAIGGGTGCFEGIELFHCGEDHAALLPLSLCMKEVGIEDEENNMPEMERWKEDNGSKIRPELLLQFEKNKPCEEKHVFTVGSCVEVLYGADRRFAVVKWVDNDGGKMRIRSDTLVAVEVEGDIPSYWTRAGTAIQKARVHESNILSSLNTDSVALVPYYALSSDDRFINLDLRKTSDFANIDSGALVSFGTLDSGVEVKRCLPTKNIENMVGRMKGIQGFRNSCYLDTTLYAMFVQSTAFDSILESRCATAADSVHTEVTDILKTEIVYPLRRFHFIRADHVLKLRRLLERLLPYMSGLTTGEKDPEEFLNALFSTVLHIEPFLSMRNVNDGKTSFAYICPLITDDSWWREKPGIINVQMLLERSFFSSNVQFNVDPKILIIQLPRYGRQKLFDKIFPSPELDITHLVYNRERSCSLCGKLAEVMCPECFLTKDVYVANVTYCVVCYQRSHNGLDHRPQQVDFKIPNNIMNAQNPEKKMRLAAVLCIETSHYVAFVYSPVSDKWVFFDSMADRVGFSQGYNVPQVKLCELFPAWLSAAGWSKVRESISTEGQLPVEVQSDRDLMRLLSDCYICFYTDDIFNKSEWLSFSRFFA